jgi:hypothetical protein
MAAGKKPAFLNSAPNSLELKIEDCKMIRFRKYSLYNIQLDGFLIYSMFSLQQTIYPNPDKPEPNRL